jgi:ABC-type transport system substrate-binding protein
MSTEALARGGKARQGRGGKLPHRLWVVVALSAVGAAACGSTGGASGSNAAAFNPASFNTSTVSWLAANVNATGTPPSTPTGTLTEAGSNDVSGMLIPQAEYDAEAYNLMRALDRPLMGNPASSDFAIATSIVPDAASAYALSSDGLTYTFTLRSGLRWAVTDPASGAPVTSDNGTPVTAQDFVRGIEEECEPAIVGYGNTNYYTATISGFNDFCNGMEALVGTGNTTANPVAATPAQVSDYINANPVSGLSAPDSSTVVITLTEPATDFLNIIAMTFADAAPPSSLNYTPLTPGNPIWSDGPYEVQTYTPSTKIVLVPNPYWGSSSGTDTHSVSWSADPNRHRYVAEISVNEALSPAAASGEVQQEIVAGTLDLEWNTVVPASSLSTLASFSNPEFGSFPAPGITNPYLVFNVQKPGPLQNVKVRQALEYAIDKAAMGKPYGGATFNQPLNQVFGPGTEGYIPGYDPYSTPNNSGDGAKCKTLLAAAGYPHGFTLNDYYRTDGNHPAIFQEVQKDLKSCGVTVTGTGVPTGYYTAAGILQATAAGAATAKWDITEPGWNPDWYGPVKAPTNARSILPDIFVPGGGGDWGWFNDPTLNTLISKAEADVSISQASSDWQAANREVMNQAPFVPFQAQLTNLMHSSHVHNAIYVPFSTFYDPTQIWLS